MTKLKVLLAFIGLIIVILSLVVVVGKFFRTNTGEKLDVVNNKTNVTHKYISNTNKISFAIDSSFSVEDGANYISLTDQSDGEIQIVRIASEYDNLTDHLSDLASLNQLQIDYLSELSKTEGSESVYVYIQNNYTTTEQTYNYFYYENGWVYSISTSKKELYEELEQIAESIEYLGE